MNGHFKRSIGNVPELTTEQMVEVDRAIAHYEASRPDAWTPVWDPLQLRGLWWTLLWAAGALAMIAWTRVRRTRSIQVAGWYLLVAAAIPRCRSFWQSSVLKKDRFSVQRSSR